MKPIRRVPTLNPLAPKAALGLGTSSLREGGLKGLGTSSLSAFFKNHAPGTTRIEVSKHDYHVSQREAPLYRACGAARDFVWGQEALGSHQGPIETSQTSLIDPSGIVFFN